MLTWNLLIHIVYKIWENMNHVLKCSKCNCKQPMPNMISCNKGTHKAKDSVCRTPRHHADRGQTCQWWNSSGCSCVAHPDITHTQECGDGTAQVPWLRVVTSLRGGCRDKPVTGHLGYVRVHMCVLEWRECMTEDDKNVCASVGMCTWKCTFCKVSLCVLWQTQWVIVHVCVCMCVIGLEIVCIFARQ